MRTKHLLMAVLITVIWGFNFSVIKLGLRSIDPFVLAGIRFTLCALPAVFFLPRPRVACRYLAGYGLLFGVGLWGIVNLGIQAGVSAGIASLVLQFSAFFTILLGAFVFRESVSKYQYAGILVALVGLANIIAITDGTVTLLGLFLVIMGALSWSAANITIKMSGTREMLGFLAWSCLFSPIPLFLIAYLSQGTGIFTQTLVDLDGIAIFSILFQAYPTTILGYWIWNSLLKTYPVSTVAPLSLLVPIFGLTGSALIFGETVGFIKVSAAALIVTGLAIGLYGAQMSEMLSSRANKQT
jgi:O-acetylserine/cysteine efflux transporter